MLELYVSIFRTSQMPLVLIISFFCYKAINVLKKRELLWISIAFGFNFLYIASEIIYYLNSSLKSIRLFGFEFKSVSVLFDFLTSYSFFVASYFWYFVKSGLNNPFLLLYKENTIKQKRRWMIIFVFLFSIILFITLLIVRFNLSENRLLKAVFCLYNCASLFSISFLFLKWSEKYSARKYIVAGFSIWGILQLLPLLNGFIIDDIIELIGFSFSMIGKIVILWGIFLWYVDFAKESERELSNERQGKEQFLKSSLVFKEILRRNFHEIILPLKALGIAIDKLAVYRSTKHHVEFDELENNYERVKAIITVSINSYHSEEQFTDDFAEEISLDTKIKIVSINTLIEMAIKLIKNNYKFITYNTYYRKNCYIACNQTQIVQVLSNLIKNSIEAYGSAELKEITIRSYVEKSKDLQKSERLVIVEVEDYAGGILEEHINKIWESGFTTKRVTETNMVRGEGLAIVKDIMSLHNRSDIVVESPIKRREGSNIKVINGTIFRLAFPKRDLPNEIKN